MRNQPRKLMSSLRSARGTASRATVTVGFGGRDRIVEHGRGLPQVADCFEAVAKSQQELAAAGVVWRQKIKGAGKQVRSPGSVSALVGGVPFRLSLGEHVW